MITCEVRLPGSQFWMVVSIVYALNDEALRKDLWEEMVQLALSPLVAGRPWIVLGDFNQILNTWDHSNEAGRKVDKRMRDFRNCLLDSELQDLVFKGSTYTWWNKSDSRPVAEKID